MADVIIDGTADVPSVTDDPMSKALLEILKISKDKLKIQITKEKMMNKCKIWDKRTATSPSGGHLGHYHALFNPFKFDSNCEKHYLEEMRDNIIEVHLSC